MQSVQDNRQPNTVFQDASRISLQQNYNPKSQRYHEQQFGRLQKQETEDFYDRYFGNSHNKSNKDHQKKVDEHLQV